MSLVNYLGKYDTIDDVLEVYPEGGRDGDYLYIDDVLFHWDKFSRKWVELKDEDFEGENISKSEEYIIKDSDVYITFLGKFDSLHNVWESYPYGGKEGDYLYIDEELRYWNKYLRSWVVGNNQESSQIRPAVSNFSETVISYSEGYINYLGSFENIAQAWESYPYGGKEGDYILVAGESLRWNKHTSNWGEVEGETTTPARQIVSIWGDLHVENDATIGEGLYARILETFSSKEWVLAQKYISMKDVTQDVVMSRVLIDDNTIKRDGNGALYVDESALSISGSSGGGGVADTIHWNKVIGKPSWIGSSKPSYKYGEIEDTPDLSKFLTSADMSGFVRISGDAQPITAQHNFANGLKIGGISLRKVDDYLYLDSSLVLSGGVTMYGDDGTTVKPIWESIPFDRTTIDWVDGKWTVVGGVGGGVADTIHWNKVIGKPSWIGSSKPSYKYGEIEDTPDLSKFLTSADMSGFVRISGDAQPITAQHNFANGLKIGGISLRKVDDYLYLDSSLVLSGGVTMYGDDGTTVKPIWESIPFDRTTIDWVDGKWTVVGGVGGGVADTIHWNKVIGKPSWIGSSKPSYKYGEIEDTPDLSKFLTSADMSGFVRISGDAQPITAQHNFANGLKIGGISLRKVDDYLYLDSSLVLSGGVTMYGDDGTTVKPIWESIPLDESTLAWLDGKLSVVGGVGSGTPDLSVYFLASNFTKANIKSTLGISDWALASAKPTYKYSEISNTPDLSVYALNTDLAKKWTQNDAKIANWDSAYSWGNHAAAGYAKASDVTNEFKNYVKLAGDSQSITAQHNFTNGLKIGGISLRKVDDYLYLDSSLVLSGGVTMYGDDGTTVKPIWESIPFDRTTIDWVDGKWTVVGGVGGGGISEEFLNVTLQGYQPKITSSNKLAYSLISGTPDLSVYALKTAIPTKLSQLTDDVVAGNYLSTKGGTVNGSITATSFIGNLIGNADSATKLATPRTIWGVSFDGSESINGDIKINAPFRIYWHNSPSTYYISSPTDNKGALLEYNAFSGHRFLGGNVVIGGTTADAKLHVYGTAKFTDNISVLSINIGGISLRKVDNYLYLDSSLVLSGGVTMYGDDGTTVKPIWESIPFDRTTIDWVDGKWTVVGGVGGGGISEEFLNVKLQGYQPLLSATNKLPYSLISDTPDLSVYAKLTDIPSLNGYATQSWVEGKGYLLASTASSTYQPKITSSNKLAYSLISGTPDLSVYALKTAIPTKLSQLTDDVVAGNYLSTKGGTVNGSITATSFIGNLIGNADSATKLATPRTIWGVSFDGSESINGDIKINAPFRIYWHNSPSTYYISSPTDNKGALLEYNAFSGHRFLGGNVVIGGTTADAKLHVYGTAKFTDNISVLSINIGGISLRKVDNYLYLDSSLVLSGGVTMYGDDGTTVKPIWESIPFDRTTIDWVDGKWTVVGGVGGGGISEEFLNVKLQGYQPLLSATNKLPYSLISDTPDLSVYAKLTDIPSLNGYATQSWVEGKGYLLASTASSTYQPKITSSNKLAYSLISGTPDLSVYALKTAIPTKLSQLTDDVVAGNYLSTKGGTVNGSITATSFIGNLIGNADSATKLATPRTIWGVSFDGSESINGDIKINAPFRIYWHNSPSTYYISSPTDNKGALLEYNAFSGHRFLGGNVVIGGTTADAKLHVYGTAKFTDNISVLSINIGGISLRKVDNYLYLDSSLVLSGGVTMYGDDGTTVKPIWESIPFDRTTIDWVDGKWTVVGGVGGGGISEEFLNVKLQGYQPLLSATNKLPYSLISDTPDLSVYAKLTDIPSLNGYATQSWVEGKGYLLASTASSTYQPKITSSNKLAYSLISGTPDLSVYALKTAIPTKLSQLTDDVVAGNYLSTKGGTVNGSITATSFIGNLIGNADSATKLATPRTIWGVSFDGSESINGDIKINAPFRIYWHNSPSTYYISSPTDNKGALLEYNAFSGHRFLGGNVVIGGTTADAKLHVYGNVKATSFIGNLVGNADSATQLATPRTIWGQSFDGTKDIAGPPLVQFVNFKGIDGSSVGYIGRPSLMNDDIHLRTSNNISIYAANVGITGAMTVDGDATFSSKVVIGTIPVQSVDGTLFVDANVVFRGGVAMYGDTTTTIN